MWCANCQADVAAEVSADNRHVRCATCSTVLDTPQTLRASARTREARELLERWSSGMVLDPYTPSVPVAAPSSAGTASEAAPVAGSAAPTTSPTAGSRRRTFRVDSPHSGILGAASASSSAESPAPTSATSDEEPLPRPPSGNSPAPRTVVRPRPLAAAKDSAPPNAGPSTSAELTEDAENIADVRPDTLPLPPTAGRAPLAASREVDGQVEAVAAESEESFESHAAPSAIPAPHIRRQRAPKIPAATPAAAAVSHRRHDNAETLTGPRRTPNVRPRPESGTRTASGHVLRFDDPQAPLAGPHLDPQAFVSDAPRRSNSTSLAGQFLAYAGVLGMTIGTAMVLWGYFGGPEHFTPTGWLITTVGQMLLFLGVVTLVSGGMEQTTDEVARRIDHLGERLLRIEQTARESQWRGHDSASDASEERAAVG
ncbi:MAG: hypothetical protein IT428_10995 [Planctomycetaceae bacterium]|nr:hypothetical protein [Planctomycetaceae bacterium]